MYQKGYEIVERDLNNQDVLTTIKKFEAALSYLLDNDEAIEKIKKTFISQATVYSSSDDEKDLIKKNKFISFLEHDMEM